MWKRLYDRKGQSTGEYALVFAIVLGAIVAMQTYVKRELQGRVRDGARYMAEGTAELGTTHQYEPYYYSSDYTTARESTLGEGYDEGATQLSTDEASARRTGGYTEHSESEEE